MDSKKECPIKSSRDNDLCLYEKPFWWLGQPNRPAVQYRNLDFVNDFTTCMPMKPLEDVDVIKNMELDQPDNYVPGQIHNSGGSSQDFKSAEIVCNSIWTPKDPNFYKEFDPSGFKEPTILHDNVMRRLKMNLCETLKEESIAHLGECSMHKKDCVCFCHSSADVAVKILEQNEKEKIEEKNHKAPTLVCKVCGCVVGGHGTPYDHNYPPFAIFGTNPDCFRDVVGRN